MPIPDEYKDRGRLMAGIAAKMLGFSKGGRLMKYSDGGRSSMFAGIPLNPKIQARLKAERESAAFKKGGRIMKGSTAMKRKMAKLRAMRK